ncbi:MAG: acyl-CoA reductase [Bacteroidales bacterium]
MITAIKRKEAFIKLGAILTDYSSSNPSFSKIKDKSFQNILDDAVQLSSENNPWFTANNINKAISAIGHSLTESGLTNWLSGYKEDLSVTHHPQTIGVVMAGNIPMVGFHDMLCVLISGNKLNAKLSNDDRFLLPALYQILMKLEPTLGDQVTFTTDQLHRFDAVIATGSNNSARYFEFYFRNYPHIIRKNRNGLAILSGSETKQQLIALGEDVFAYFGLGCRNVSKILLPQNYQIATLLDTWEPYSYLANHSRYMNNYSYRKNVYLINAMPHFDNGFVLLLPSDAFSAPIGVVNFSYYEPDFAFQSYLENNRLSIQCIVGGDSTHPQHVDYGNSQQPYLWDYADGVDTIKFLLSLRVM